jgi:hypothetical protein
MMVAGADLAPVAPFAGTVGVGPPNVLRIVDLRTPNGCIGLSPSTRQAISSIVPISSANDLDRPFLHY